MDDQYDPKVDKPFMKMNRISVKPLMASVS
jgi:hypothetical protein